MKTKAFFYFSLQALAAFFCFQASAQVSKLGKVSDEELNMKVYAKDSSAAAVVLFDVGNTAIKLDHTEGVFKLYHTRHRRIKILSKEGYEFADIRIPIYHSTSNNQEEELEVFKGFTHYISEKGFESIKFGKKDLFKESVSTNWKQFKFSAPQAKEGSIVEYSYTISSDFFFNFQSWEFQDKIPTVYSEYSSEIPDYFTYRNFPFGYVAFAVKENSSFYKKESLMMRVKEEYKAGAYTGQTVMTKTDLDYNVKTLKWGVKDAPAVKTESYIASANDLTTKVEFQLVSIQMPGSAKHEYLESWEKLSEELLQEEKLGKQMNKKGPMREVLEAIGTPAGTDMEKIAYAYENASKSIRWNGFNGIYAEHGIKQAIVKGEGNSADINLYLINTLRALDMDAHPVILSTRSHGKINEYYPQLEKFNYLIAYVKTAEGYLLIDAADTSVPLGQLPFKSLNTSGRLLKEGASDWIPLSGGDFNAAIMAQISFTEDGKTKAAVKLTQKNYEAAQTRQAMTDQGETEFIKNAWDFASAGLELASHKVTGLDDKKQPLSITLDLQSEDGGALEDMLYLNPFVVKDFDKNPLTMEERKFPVDFGAPLNYSYITAIQIPAGYVAQSIPQPISVNLPNGGGKFTYNAAVNGNTIQVSSKIALSKPVYLAEEYALLKQFFAQIVAKQGEQVVLKKQ